MEIQPIKSLFLSRRAANLAPLGVDILPAGAGVAAVSIIDCRSAKLARSCGHRGNRLTSRPPLMRKIAAKTIIARVYSRLPRFFCTSRSRAGDSPRRYPGRRRPQVPAGETFRQIGDCIGCLYLNGRGPVIIWQRCIACGESLPLDNTQYYLRFWLSSWQLQYYCLYYTTCAAKRQGKYHTKICKKHPSPPCGAGRTAKQITRGSRCRA